MRTILITPALIATLGTQVGARCGNLCYHFWRVTATTADVQAELDAGADVVAWDGRENVLIGTKVVDLDCKFLNLERNFCKDKLRTVPPRFWPNTSDPLLSILFILFNYIDP
jgi:hypothetical protein